MKYNSSVIICCHIYLGIDWLIVTLAMIGRFAVSYIFSVIFIYTSEIYPTALRTISLSVCATFARVGGVIAPYLILLVRILN